MENEVTMGMNRTGAQMSPLDVKDVAEFARARTGQSEAGMEEEGFVVDGYAAVHRDYILEAEAVGSVPLPGTVRGMASAVLEKLKGDKPSVLIDKLGERLAFERTGVR